MRKRILIFVCATVFVVGIFTACGSGDRATSTLVEETKQTEDNTETKNVEETKDNGIVAEIPYSETDTEETKTEENTEETIEKGSKQSPYKLGETVTITLFASNLYDVNMIPATVDITLNEYSEKFVECEISLSNCETDSAVDFLVTLFPKIIDTQMTEMGQYTISREPEGLSSSISMYNGGSTTGYIQLKVNDDEGVPQYVVLQYYKCSDINVPKEENDWTETWFELTRE